MPARIRFLVTPVEPAADFVVRRFVRAGSGSDGEPTRGEREVAEGADGRALRVCAAVNAAFSGEVRGARVSAECEGTEAVIEEASANASPAVRDVDGAGANAALLKLLGFPAAIASRAKQPEASRAEPDGFVVAKANGGAAAVVESLRGLACVGAKARSLAVDVAWPNPSNEAILKRVGGALCAAAEASRALGLTLEDVGIRDAADVVGEVVAIGEAPEGVPLLGSFARGAGERLVFLGETPKEVGGSRFLEAVHGLPAEAGVAAEWSAEKRLHTVLRTLTAARVITAARGIGEGGLMTAVCGMLLGGERTWGARLDLTPLGGTRADALLFGEGGSRAIVEVAADRVGTVISEAHMNGVPAALIGEVTAEDLLDLKTRSLATTWKVAELAKVWEIAGPARGVSGAA